MESAHKSYAIALFDLALETNKVEVYQEEVKAISNILKENKEFFDLLTNQFVSKEDKKNMLHNVFFSKIENMILNFLKLLIDKSRFNLSIDIFKEFNSLANDHRNIKEGILYSAISLDDARVKAIEEKVAKKIGKNVELSLVVDASLIGGIKVVIDDLIIDNSIKNRIESLSSDLKTER